jgi:hypothetical protein
MNSQVITRIATIVKIANRLRNDPNTPIAVLTSLTPNNTELELAARYVVANMLGNVKKSELELARELNERKYNPPGVP